MLKDAEPIMEVVFITGVSAFSKVSLFSDLNNLTNLTIDPIAGTLTGITERELEANFGSRLDELSRSREQVREWYNGYNWLGEARVYNPWSVLTYLKTGELDNYWIQTGTPTFLTKLMTLGGEYDVAGTPASAHTLTSLDLAHIPPAQLMFQTGYLTIRERGPMPGSYLLDYPNVEVKGAFLDALLDAYRPADNWGSTNQLSRLRTVLGSGDAEGLIAFTDALFAAVPYELWQRQTEAFYHAILHTAFTLLGVYFQSEVSVANGRADVLAEMGDFVWALEFKLDRPAAEALAQIEDRDYLGKYAGSGKQLIAMGISFSSAERKVAEWEVKRTPQT